MLTQFFGTCQDNQNGLISSRKVVVLYEQKGADEDQPMEIVADEWW